MVVSIHINSATSPDAYGCEVWYPNGSSYNYYLHDEGYDFSQKILAKLEALGLYNRGAKIKDYGVGDAGYPDGSASDYYGVIRYAREASILGVIIEHAFITSPSDADKLRNDAFLKELGIADAQAIMEKFGQVLNISSSVASIGEPITVSPVSGAGFAGCAFNYVWRYGDGWGDWDSTLNSTGALTQESTYQFVPSKGGHYTLYADIHYPDGRVETLENSVEVKYWSFDSITAPDKGFVGLTSTYSPNFTGDTTGLTYNYVWAYEGLWSEGDWSSTVKETGSNTSKTSGSFTPTKPGIYKLFIDAVAPDGYKRTLQKNITVDKSSWELSSVNAPSTATMGTPVEFSPKLTGDAAGLTYNYVWTYEGLWSEGDWSSTVKETGANTKDMSGTFTPTKPGTYRLYVDAVDAYGNKTTKDATVQVGFGWTFDGVSAPASATVGTPVEFSPKLTGDAAGLTYNYVWTFEGRWGADDWSSTVKDTGSNTTAKSGTFTPTKPGTYRLYVDAVDAYGNKTTKDATVQVGFGWTFDGVSAPASATVGTPVEFSPKLTGDAAGLTYNYVWTYEGLWSEGDWSSTVKETGANTKDMSGTFTPTKPGTYRLYVDAVDAYGNKTTKDATVQVGFGWTFDGVSAPASATVGTPVEFSPKLTGDAAGLTYNYVWTFEGRWGADDWSSTVKDTGSNTTAKSGTFTPTKPGTYRLYVDAVDAYGNKTTKDATVQVGFGWTFDGVSAPASATVGTPVEFSPKLTGDAAGLTYNYVWTYEGLWSEGDWSSTVKETGANTKDMSGTFTPTKPGTYRLYVDAVDAYGNKTTKDATVKAIGTNIMGASESNASQMARYYVSKSLPYPSVVYASKGAGDLATFCNIVSEEAAAEGVRADVVFCQAMKETGWLQFTGDVKAEQCNFCGLGATGGGNPGLSFESVRMGVRAHVQHLKAYASTDPLVNDCVDPRFTYVTRGIAPTLEELNGRWAVPGNNYGQDIAAMIKEMQKA